MIHIFCIKNVRLKLRMCQLFVSEIVSFMFFSIINELWNSFFGLCWSFQNFLMFFFSWLGREHCCKVCYKRKNTLQNRLAPKFSISYSSSQNILRSPSKKWLQIWFTKPLRGVKITSHANCRNEEVNQGQMVRNCHDKMLKI